MKFHVHGGMAFWYCLGCGHGHSVTIGRENDIKGPCWQWNGSTAVPTLSPSIRHFSPAHERDGEQIPERTTCHYFIRDGFIEYCDDSSAHALRGSHILPDFPDDYALPGLYLPPLIESAPVTEEAWKKL